MSVKTTAKMTPRTARPLGGKQMEMKISKSRRAIAAPSTFRTSVRANSRLRDHRSLGEDLDVWFQTL